MSSSIVADDIGDLNVDAKLTYIARFAELVGAPEAAVRLLFTILAGYPIAKAYRSYIIPINNITLHHIYFALSGILLCIYNYGSDTYHSLIAILITYLFIHLFHKNPNRLIIINFVFHMGYLLIGYYFTESNDYDILWTMPHCVLTLRMIGFGFDIADGRKPDDDLSKEQRETALREMPNLLELFAFAYFPCSFLVGPQFPYKRYQRFINGEFRQYEGAERAGIVRFLTGMTYLAVRQFGGTIFPDSYFLTDAFRNEPFVLRLLYLGLWAKFALYKYISCWLLTEGSLMLIGFTYAGTNADGTVDWSGCSNVKLILLETGNTMGHYVQSFNVNTNQWVAQYVYKRLKFLNNRTISYGAALGFLAVWHGFHAGYYMAFLIEYMIVTVEKQIETVYEKDVLPAYGDVLNNSKIFLVLKFIALKLYNLIYMGWCLIPFIYLKFSRWLHVFSAVNYFGFVYVGTWLVINHVLQHFKRKNKQIEKMNRKAE